jgi:hypothetical protein
MSEEFKKTAQSELSEMEEHIAKLQSMVEENRNKIKNLLDSSESDFEEHKGTWSKAVEDWRGMMRFFSKS